MDRQPSSSQHCVNGRHAVSWSLNLHKVIWLHQPRCGLSAEGTTYIRGSLEKQYGGLMIQPVQMARGFREKEITGIGKYFQGIVSTLWLLEKMALGNALTIRNAE